MSQFNITSETTTRTKKWLVRFQYTSQEDETYRMLGYDALDALLTVAQRYSDNTRPVRIVVTPLEG